MLHLCIERNGIMSSFSDHLQHQFIHHFPYSDVRYRMNAQAGLDLYRTHSFFILHNDEQILNVKIDSFYVELNKQLLPESTCSCQHNGFCEHCFAAFFYMYSLIEPLAPLFKEWRNHEKAALTMLSAKQVLKKPKATFQEWRQTFEEQYTLFMQGRNENDRSIYHEYYQYYYRALVKKAPEHPLLYALFCMYGGVHTFYKLSAQLQAHQLSTNIEESFVYSHVYKITNEIYATADSLKQMKYDGDALSIIEDSIPYIRELLHKDMPLQYERIEIYRVIWQKIFTLEKWRKTEESKLKAKYGSFINNTALSYLLFLQEKDEEAKECLSDETLQTIPYLIPWLNDLLHEKEPDRFAQWGSYIMTYIGDYVRTVPTTYQGSRNMVSMIVNLFQHYKDLTNDQTLYIEALQTLLPYSFIEYSDFLYASDQLKKWVELQVLLQYDSIKYDEQTIEALKQKDEKLVIPLYHQMISKLIYEKKKSSYQEAYIYLQELKRLYLQMNRSLLWEHYMEELAIKTKKQRSFQQLLEKGDLLNV